MLFRSTYKNIKPIGICLLFALLFGSCKSSFKQNFSDFRAHYNTFFNAKKSFESGLEKNDSQLRDYNPYLPIRVHQAPVNAGNQDFQQSIDKGADIIRKHSTSKWVDDAIELIGKSYYYRQEFFSADQKFQELYEATTDTKLKQNAVYWRGRTYLDLELYQEGINFITEQLAIFDNNWDRSIEAEVRVVLAEHLIQLQNYDEAEIQLASSVSELTTNSHKARGYFLYGQILEYNEKLDDALVAYSRVQKHYEDYNLFFLAQVKRGQLTRDLKQWDYSYDIFFAMGRDDKNFERKADLDYELARTEQKAGNYASAENIYYSVLDNELDNPTKETIAKSYYGLGEIHSEFYNDYTLAAAYFDSAAQQNIPLELLPKGFNPEELASSFGQYAQLTQSIQLIDSLLWLGSLSKPSLDSVVLELKKVRREELLEEIRQEEIRKNTLVNVTAPQGPVQAGINQQNGFLNSKSPALLSDARAQFQAIWGDRPLADNWRRAAAIRVSLSDTLRGGPNQNNTSSSINTIDLADIEIDLSSVPFTEEQKNDARMSLAEELFQLGNLFFLSLNMPDSAEFYFSKVISNYPTSDTRPVAIYSLSELYISNNNPEKAKEIAFRLIDRYPNTIYAERVRNRYQIEHAKISTKPNSSDSLLAVYHTYKNDPIDQAKKASSLKNFALENPTSELAPIALYDAITAYADMAKDSSYNFDIIKYTEEKNTYFENVQLLTIRQDSARLALADTSTTKKDSLYWNSVIELNNEEPVFDTLFPYKGAYWDSTRTALNLFTQLFPEAPLLAKIELLKTELAIPNTQQASIGSNLPSTPTYYNCKDLGVELKIKDGKSNFLAIILDEGITLNNDLTYTFRISENGEITSYQNILRGNQAQQHSNFENVIDDYLAFEEIKLNGVTVAVECDITFPANNKD